MPFLLWEIQARTTHIQFIMTPILWLGCSWLLICLQPNRSATLEALYHLTLHDISSECALRDNTGIFFLQFQRNFISSYQSQRLVAFLSDYGVQNVAMKKTPIPFTCVHSFPATVKFFVFKFYSRWDEMCSNYKLILFEKCNSSMKHIKWLPSNSNWHEMFVLVVVLLKLTFHK